MFFVCPSKILHKHCLQFLLGVKMAPRETENNAYAKFWGDNQKALWYVMVFSGVANYLWVVTKLEHRSWSSWLWNPPRTNRHWAAAFNSVQYLHIISFNKIIIFNKKTKTTKPCGSREARIIVIKCEILRKPETEPVCWSFTKRRACLRWWLTSLALTVLYLPVKASEWLSS